MTQRPTLSSAMNRRFFMRQNGAAALALATPLLSRPPRLRLGLTKPRVQGHTTDPRVTFEAFPGEMLSIRQWQLHCSRR
jgi:hypothetical protein